MANSVPQWLGEEAGIVEKHRIDLQIDQGAVTASLILSVVSNHLPRAKSFLTSREQDPLNELGGPISAGAPASPPSTSPWPQTWPGPNPTPRTLSRPPWQRRCATPTSIPTRLARRSAPTSACPPRWWRRYARRLHQPRPGRHGRHRTCKDRADVGGCQPQTTSRISSGIRLRLVDSGLTLTRRCNVGHRKVQHGSERSRR